MLKRALLTAAGFWLAVQGAAAVEIRVAVASNFSRVAELLAFRFEEQTNYHVTLIPGSTGKHYAQISNGAPFDLFLAADVERPELLEKGGLAVEDTRVTYAFGQLLLWSPTKDRVDSTGRVLRSGDFRNLAIANPDLAPYGQAAKDVLVSLELWEDLQDRLVRGESIGQAFQMVATGNADLGFISLSQIFDPSHPRSGGSYWAIPDKLYKPIEQQAVLLKDMGPAREFLEFLGSQEARRLIQQHGYKVP